jgi:hypothetical protein
MPVAMRLIQRVGDLDGARHCFVDRKRTSFEACRERLTLEVFHHEVAHWLPGRYLLLADVVEGADVRVVKARDGLGFARKALAELRIVREALVQDLEGNGAIETGVARLVDLAHASGTECSGDFIWAESSTDGEAHRSSLIETRCVILAGAGWAGRAGRGWWGWWAGSAKT